MSFLGGILKNLNPLKLVTDAIGGWAGNLARIAGAVVQGIASGKPLGDILKDVLKEAVALAVKMAVTAFTGGTAGLFINSIVDKLQGVLGGVAAKVLESGLSKPVAEFFSKQIGNLATSVTSDAVRSQISNVVLSATGLPNENAYLDPKMIDTDKITQGLSGSLNGLLPKLFSWSDLGTTQGGLLKAMAGSPRRDEFVAR